MNFMLFQDLIQTYFKDLEEIDKHQELLVYICGLMADARPLVDHIYRKWTEKLQIVLQQGNVGVIKQVQGFDRSRIVPVLTTLLREVLPAGLDGMPNRKSHGNQTFMTSLMHQLYRESKVPLLGNPVHNHHINYYNHDEDDFWKRPRDTTQVYTPSRFYWFANIRENIPHEVQTDGDRSEREVKASPNTPECSICIEKPGSRVAPGLLSICNTIGRQQAIKDLWIRGLSCSVPSRGKGLENPAKGTRKPDEAKRTTKGEYTSTAVAGSRSLTRRPFRNQKEMAFVEKLLASTQKREQDLPSGDPMAESLRARHEDYSQNYDVINKGDEHRPTIREDPLIDVSSLKGQVEGDGIDPSRLTKGTRKEDEAQGTTKVEDTSTAVAGSRRLTRRPFRNKANMSFIERLLASTQDQPSGSPMAESLQAWQEDYSENYNVINKADESCNANKEEGPIDVSSLKGFNISRDARIIWLFDCRLPNQVITRLEEQLSECTYLERLHVVGLPLEKIPLLYSADLQSLKYLNFAKSLIPIEDFLKTCKNLPTMSNLEFVDCNTAVDPSRRDQVEAALAEMINFFIIHHQRELVLVIPEHLSDAFKEKWRGRCKGTNVALFFGNEYEKMKGRERTEIGRRKMAEIRSDTAEIAEILGDMKKLRQKRK